MALSLHRSGFWMWFRIIKAALGAGMGVLAAIVFSFGYGALTTSAWAVISSWLSLIVLHQHLLFRKSKLASFYNTARLKYLIGGGIICLIGSLPATIYYFSMKVYLSQETYPISKSYLISGVWAFMTLKWSGLLIFYSFKHKKKIEGEMQYNHF